MRRRRLGAFFTMVTMLMLCRPPTAPAASVSEVEQLRQEIRALRAENERSRKRVEQLEQKVDQFQATQEQKQKDLEGHVAKEVEKQTATATRRTLESYVGENRFVVTGFGAASFEWERHPQISTFAATISPVLLFRASDRVLFEAEPEFGLKEDGTTEVNLEYAQADVLLNDHATLVAGKFLLPFGEFIQQLHAAWVNKLVSFPLPYREDEEGGILPFSDVGVQLRGGTRLFGREGVNLDYTAFVSNGPRFESEAVGARFEANNVDPNHGKGFGARLGLFLAPPNSTLGNLKLGASTYDGKWDTGGNHWFTSWGVDASYHLDELEARGEYLQTFRNIPAPMHRDRREGWYAQLAYKLARLPGPYLNRVELVTRYSGVNQRAVTTDELLPNPRQVALGIDYWLTPSIVGKLEYDRDLPQRAVNDHAIRAQLGVGF